MSERSTRMMPGHSASASVRAGSTKKRRFASGSSVNGT
ncbi:hypothetical protein ACVIU7_006223 [Bradyrhizobium liaoningense]